MHSHLLADFAAGFLNILASKMPHVGDYPAHAPLGIPAAKKAVTHCTDRVPNLLRTSSMCMPLQRCADDTAPHR